MWLQWCIAFTFLTVIAKPSLARLYRRTKIPIKDPATTTYREDINVTTRVQCASTCDSDPNNCKAFTFNPINKTCIYIKFEYALPAVASSSHQLYGYVENGLLDSFVSFICDQLKVTHYD